MCRKYKKDVKEEYGTIAGMQKNAKALIQKPKVPQKEISKENPREIQK